MLNYITYNGNYMVFYEIYMACHEIFCEIPRFIYVHLEMTQSRAENLLNKANNNINNHVH